MGFGHCVEDGEQEWLFLARIVALGAFVMVVMVVAIFVGFFLLAFAESMTMGDLWAVVRGWDAGVCPGCMSTLWFVLSS